MSRKSKELNISNLVEFKNFDGVDKIYKEITNELEQYLSSKKLLDFKELHQEFDNIKDFDDINRFKTAVLKQVLYILKYGSSNERVKVLAELLKYLFPTKRDVNLRHSGNIKIVVNPLIMGEVKDVDTVDEDKEVLENDE